MTKTNPLDELMEKFSTKLKYKIPLGLFPEEIDKQYPYEGVEVALVFYWSYNNNLLNRNINKMVKKLYSTSLTHKKLISIMKSTIGIELLNSFYNENGKEFVVDYVAFTNQWHYQFYKDLEEMHPNIRSFSEIPETQESYDEIFKLLDIRFLEYKGSDINSSPNKEEEIIKQEKTHKTNQLQLNPKTYAPTTGDYQAFLPKGHSLAQSLKSDPMAYCFHKKGSQFSNIGLEEYEPRLIEWRIRKG